MVLLLDELRIVRVVKMILLSRLLVMMLRGCHHVIELACRASLHCVGWHTVMGT
jgi:hypothetical protein